MMNLSLKSFHKFIASGVATAILVSTPGYQVVAQSAGMRTGEVVPSVQLSAANAINPAEENFFDLQQPSLTSGLSATAGVGEHIVVNSGSQPSLHAQTSPRSAGVAMQESTALLRQESGISSWRQRGAALLKGLGELALPRNFRDGIADGLNRLYEAIPQYQRQELMPAGANIGYSASNFASRRIAHNNWALHKSSINGDALGSAGSVPPTPASVGKQGETYALGDSIQGNTVSLPAWAVYFTAAGMGLLALFVASILAKSDFYAKIDLGAYFSFLSLFKFPLAIAIIIVGALGVRDLKNRWSGKNPDNFSVPKWAVWLSVGGVSAVLLSAVVGPLPLLLFFTLAASLGMED